MGGPGRQRSASRARSRGRVTGLRGAAGPTLGGRVRSVGPRASQWARRPRTRAFMLLSPGELLRRNGKMRGCAMSEGPLRADAGAWERCEWVYATEGGAGPRAGRGGAGTAHTLRHPGYPALGPHGAPHARLRYGTAFGNPVGWVRGSERAGGRVGSPVTRSRRPLRPLDWRSHAILKPAAHAMDPGCVAAHLVRGGRSGAGVGGGVVVDHTLGGRAVVAFVRTIVNDWNNV